MASSNIPTALSDWKPVFDFLEHESKFQAAAAAITGAAAAWWLKTVLGSRADHQVIPHPTASGLAAALLMLAAFLFFVDQGRLAKKYGELARYVADDRTVPPGWANHLVRDVYDPGSVTQWFPYYAARVALFAVGGIVLWMLFR